MQCPDCGATDNPDRARFCHRCGHSMQQMVDERRVVTVLFADLVGFTSLSEASDPEAVKRTIDRAFQRLVADVTAFGGVIDKIVGDGILAIFGAPTAHEDDPERAVRSALAMQDSLTTYASEVGADFRIRIGVNTGEALVGQLQAGGDWTAMGDVVNTACRLQEAAAPGEVLAGPATHSATQTAIHYEPRGLIAVKGRDEPVDVHSAMAASRPPGYRDRQLATPLVGRDSEFAMLNHAIDSAFQSRRSYLVVLRGEAGVGKTRLAADVARAARLEHGAVVLVGQCVPYGEANIWWPLAEVLRRGAGIEPDAGPTEVRRALDVLVESLFTEAEPDERDRLVHGLLELLGEDSPLRRIDPARARAEVARSIIAVGERSAEQRPLVVRISDVHWASPEVVELLDELLQRLGHSPFVLIATARAVEADWHPTGGRHNVIELTIDPLEREAAAHLLDQLLGTRVSASMKEDILDRSGGNPFFLEELVTLVSADDAESSESSDRVLPETLRGIVAARLDNLGVDAMAVVENAAVWGSSGPIEALERMAEALRRTTDLVTVIDELEREEILEFVAGRWSFRSDSVREVAYTRLTKSARRIRHEGIGNYFAQMYPEPVAAPQSVIDVIAHHFACAAQLALELGEDVVETSERALPWVEEAAERATQRDLHRVAADLRAQVLVLLDDGPSLRRVSHELDRTESLLELWETDQAEAQLSAGRATAEALGNGRARARVMMLQGELETRRGEFDAGRVSLAAAADAFTALGDSIGRAQVERRAGTLELLASDYEAARWRIVTALEAFRESRDRQGEAWALQNLSWIDFVSGRVDDAERWARESAAMFAELGDVGGFGFVQGLMAFIHFHRGEAAEAEELGRTVLADAVERGDTWGEGMLRLLLASIALFANGDIEAAIAESEQALDIHERTGDEPGRAQAVAVLAVALAVSGRVSEAYELLGEWEPAGESAQGTLLTIRLGIAGYLGEPARAVDDAAAFSELSFDPAAVGPRDGIVALGLYRLQTGDLGGALEILDPTKVMSASDPHPALVAASTLFAAVTGRDLDVELGFKTVVDDDHSTYRDRFFVRVAELLRAARTGDSTRSIDVLEDLVADVEGRGDAIAPLVAGMAGAAALSTLGDEFTPRAEDLRDRSTRRRQALGLGLDGWSKVIAMALAPREHPPEPAASSAS